MDPTSNEPLPPATPPAPESLSRWQQLRRHPLLSRLPIFLVIGLGYWLWTDPTGPGERELVFELQGPASAEVRSFEVQVMGANGVLMERAQRFFQGAPPREIRVKARLPQEKLDLLLFAKDAQGRALPLQRREVEISEREAYLLRVTVRGAASDAAPDAASGVTSDVAPGAAASAGPAPEGGAAR